MKIQILRYLFATRQIAMLSSAYRRPRFYPPTPLTIIVPSNEHSGDRVPGDSPFVYRSDPANDLFQIERLDMYPNPWTMRVESLVKKYPSEQSLIRCADRLSIP